MAQARTRHWLSYSSWRRYHKLPSFTTQWRAVEPVEHGSEAVDAALGRRVGVVHDAILERECAHAGPFSPVGRPDPLPRSKRSRCPRDRPQR